jgi:rare lipoprotein A
MTREQIRLNTGPRDDEKDLMGGKPTPFGRALLAAALASAAAVVASGGATAEDLETVREEAETAGDEITALEHELVTLRDETQQIRSEIEAASRDIGLLESDIHAAEAALARARDRYVERAVEAYKAGPAAQLELVLSARNMSDLYALAEATEQVSALDAEALEDLMQASATAEAAQERLDDRKQKLMAANAESVALEESMETKLAQRQEAFEALNAEIEKLERQARREARATAAAGSGPYPSVPTGVPGGTAYGVHPPDRYEGTGPADSIPETFEGTGLRFEGEASWYGPGFEGQTTANGDIFDSSLYTVASKELPLGSYLFVQRGGRGVVVYVNDRGPYVGNRILDLSRAAAQAVGISGVGWVRAEVIIKK